MSDRIDRRIVEMSFENAKYEKGIAQSKRSLREFSEALNKTTKTDGFSGLEKSVVSLSESFSMLEQVGIGALRRIGESAVNAGAKLVKSLTVDQLTAGWSKYEQKIASVQTIMNATGKSLDEVNDYLDQLMWFSDETSYGFTDMTAALAQMTTSGGDIKHLIPMITGVANATAFAGKGAAEFSRAMYNLNQSYGAGNLQYVDWRSLELAGVAGKQLKEILIETGIEMGTLNKKGQTVKGTVVDIGNFGTTLQEKWANTKVMERAFGKFSELSDAAYKLVKEGKYDTASEAMDSLAGKYSAIADASFRAAQTAKTFGESISATMDAVSSGWMRTYEIIFGTLEEAKANFTYITEILWDVFASGAEKRNETLAWLKEFGGISNIFKGIKNVAVALLKVLQPISKAFDQFFPPKTKEQWLSITESFSKFTQQLIISDKIADKIRRTFAGVFAVIDIGWQVVKFLSSAVMELIKTFLPLGDGILGTTANLGDFLVMLNQAIKSSKFFQYALLAIRIAAIYIKKGIQILVSTVLTFVDALWNAEDPLGMLRDLGKKVFGGLFDIITNITNWVGGKFTTAFAKAKKVIEGLFGTDVSTILSNISTAIKSIGNALFDKVTPGFNEFGEVLKTIDFSKITKFVIGGTLLMFVVQVDKLLGAVTKFANSGASLMDTFKKKLVGPAPNTLKDLAYAVAALAASMWLLSKIPAEDLSRSLRTLALAIATFVVAYASIQTINVLATRLSKGDQIKSAFGLVGLAASLGVMAIALKAISNIEGDIWRSMAVLSALMGLIISYQVLSALISKIPGQSKLQNTLLGISLGLLGIIGVIKIINKMTLDEVEAAYPILKKITLIIFGVELFVSRAAKLGGGNKLSSSVLSVSVGILAMIGVVKLVNAIDMSNVLEAGVIILGLGGILGITAMLFGTAAKIGGGKKLSASILSIIISLTAMVGLLYLLDSFSKESLTNGVVALAGLGGIIAGIQILTALAVKLGGGQKIAPILLSTTITMWAMVGLIKIISRIKDDELKKGLATLAHMAAIIVGIELLTAASAKISNGKKVAVSIGAVALSLIAITGALVILSMIDAPSLKAASTAMLKGAAALAGITIAFGFFFTVADVMAKGTKGFKEKVKNIGLMLVSLGALLIGAIGFFGALKLILPIVDSISWDSLNKFIVGMGVVATLISVMARSAMGGGGLLSRIKGLLPGFVAMTAVLLGTMGFFGALKLILPIVDSVNWNSLGKFIVGLGVVAVLMGVMGAMSTAFSIAGALGAEVLLGVLVTIGAVAMIVLAVVGLAALLNLLIKDADTLTRGLDLLVQVGAGIGRFVGAMVGGLAGGVLEDLGHSLMAFVESLSGFSPELLQGIKALSEAILIITAMALLEGITSFVAGKSSIETFGVELKALVNVLKDITAEDAFAASTALAAMKPMADNLRIFAEAAKEIPNSGGFIGDFMGENDIDTFGDMLVGFIRAFLGVTAADATHSSNVLTAMAPMAENLKLFGKAAANIPNSGGFIGDFLGTVDLTTFSTQIYGLINLFGGVDTGELNAATSSLQLMSNTMLPALLKFSEFTNGLKASGGLAQLFTGNTTLSEFGEEFKKFVKKLSEVDFSVIAPAMTAMSEITTSFETLGANVLENARMSFENNKEPFQKSITTILDIPIQTLDEKKNALVNAVSEVFKAVTDKGEYYVLQFRKLGGDIIEGLKSGIESKQASAIDSTKGVLNSIITFSKKLFDAHSPSRVFETIGGWCTLGLANGLSKETQVAVKAGVNMAKKTEEGVRDTLGVHSLSEIFSNIGGWIPTSIGEGIQNGKNYLLDMAQSLGIDTSNLTLSGVKDALTGGSGMLTDGISSLLAKLTGEALPTAEDSGDILGGALGGASVSAFQNSLTDPKTGIGGTKTKEKVKTELEKLQDFIEDENYFGRMSLQEELDAYLKIQTTYKEGSEERKKIDREVYRLTKKIYESQLEYIKEVKDAQKEAADERLELEKEYNENVADLEKSAAEKRIDAQEKYANDSKAINERLLSDIAYEQQKYEDAVNSRSNSIASSYELFSKPGKSRKVSGEKLLDYLESQNVALKDWQDQLNALEQRGIKGGLLEELQEMGPSKTGELKGLLALTDEQLTEYANIFESKNALARSRATRELEGLKADTNKAINDLIATSKLDLADLEAAYENTLSDINSELNTKLTELRTNFTTSQQNINTDLEVKLTELEEKYNTTMESIDAKTTEEMTKLIEENNIKLEQLNKDTDIKLTNLEKAYDESGTKITKEFDKDLKQLPTISRTNATTAINEVNALRPEWEKAGSNAGQGFAKGLSDSTWYAITAARALARAAVEAANNALDTHSPSKVFFNIGAFVSKGFAKGIDQYAWQAEESSESLANSIISIVGDSLKSINELSDDYSPVITPVIDLSNASAGASKLNSLFGHSYSIGATSKKNASALSTNRPDHFDRLIESIEGKSLERQMEKEPNIQFTQNNYSPKALSRLDIYRQTRNQISTLKGLIRV